MDYKVELKVAFRAATDGDAQKMCSRMQHAATTLSGINYDLAVNESKLINLSPVDPKYKTVDEEDMDGRMVRVTRDEAGRVMRVTDKAGDIVFSPRLVAQRPGVSGTPGETPKPNLPSTAAPMPTKADPRS